MLSVLFERYKSKRFKYHLYYDREFFDDRLKPFMILQVGVESSLQVWQRYFSKSQIYCIDSFANTDPKNISYLSESRINWSRCDVHNKKQVEHIMKNIYDMKNEKENAGVQARDMVVMSSGGKLMRDELFTTDTNFAFFPIISQNYWF